MFSKDMNNEISYEEFEKMMMCRMGDLRRQQDIIKVFQVYDHNNSGYISRADVLHVFEILDVKMTSEELNEIYEEIDAKFENKV